VNDRDRLAEHRQILKELRALRQPIIELEARVCIVRDAQRDGADVAAKLEELQVELAELYQQRRALAVAELQVVPTRAWAVHL
jgi:hypothetical protein